MEEDHVALIERLSEEMYRKIEQDSRCVEWFNRFRKDDWDHFIKYYSSFRYGALNNRDHYLDSVKPAIKEFNEYGQNVLKQIQWKKLLNLECEWRADRIKLPGIEYSHDFHLLKEEILECPLVPPVSKEEMELYLSFLESPFAEICEDEDEFCQTDYLNVKYALEKNIGTIPAWFTFYDRHYGTEFLAGLPDVRGDKERHYCHIGMQAKPKKAAAPQAPPDPELAKPSMSTRNFELFEEFARTFESEEDAAAIFAKIKCERFENDHLEIDDYIEYLKGMPQPVALVPHDDWRVGIMETVWTYKRDMVMKVLPRVWRQYRMKIGDEMEANLEKRRSEFKMDLERLDSYGTRKLLVGYILKGREILGEPRDLNF